MSYPNMNAPELGSDADDDEALRYAIALSLQDQGGFETNDGDLAHNGDGSAARKLSKPQQASFGSVQLDRKKMEEQRLQRLAKRRRADSADNGIAEVPPPKKIAQAKPSPVEDEKARVPFPHATVKRTWARGYSRTSDDIKIEEVFQKDQLLLAVLSSFQWDEEWMISKLDMSKTKVLLMAFAADDAQKSAMRANVPPSIKFCFPPMIGPGSMHSKLQLLKFPNYLRLAIPTGNLVPYDWGESGVMENVCGLLKSYHGGQG
jgi:hypothetical protein